MSKFSKINLNKLQNAISDLGFTNQNIYRRRLILKYTRR